ncbi:MAG: CHAT domain-containing protein [Chitinophagaceae bacterium]|nr:CHAT domain-containing protein [Chitinophagaceae bacterium]
MKFLKSIQQAEPIKKRLRKKPVGFSICWKKNKALQTYTNYLALKFIFEDFAPDKNLAKKCADKADQLIRESVGREMPKTDYGSDSANQWHNVIFPALYQNTDPDIPNKAASFLSQYSSFRTNANYNALAYSYEKNGDYKNALKYYQEALKYGDERNEHKSYLYFILFLTRSGELTKAEEMILKLEQLTQTADEPYRLLYRNEMLSARSLFHYFTGDYESYIRYSEIQNRELLKMYAENKIPCSGADYIHFNNVAVASELLKKFDQAERYWKLRDSAYAAWLKCQRKTYPNLKLYDFSLWPVFLLKRGKNKQLPKPLSFYAKEAEVYYNSISQYVDLSIGFHRAQHFGFLYSPLYKKYFQELLEKIRNTKDFKESTRPFSEYAYFLMRDGNLSESEALYKELFLLNKEWINDILFAFGEKTFTTYFVTKLKEGYENFLSFVKLAKDKRLPQFASLAGQAYNNLLFTKSISLQGVKKRKDAFVNSNNREVVKLYEEWIDKKQILIREYLKSATPAGPGAGQPDTAGAGKLIRLQEEVNQMENQLAARAKDFKRLLKITPPDWKEIKARLKENEAAVEIIRFQWKDQVYYSDTAYYAAYFITPESSHPDVIFMPVLADEMENKHYKLYKNNIRFKIDDNASYNIYWKPIKEKLQGIRKIYFSPDGVYHLINLYTLKNPETGKYVLDETEIQYVTSTGDLLYFGGGDKEMKNAILIGRPEYNVRLNKSGTNKPGDGTRSFVSAFRNNQVTDLPGTEEEVAVIGKELEKNKIAVQPILKQEATEDKLYNLNSPGILHIATHGYWSESGLHAAVGYRLFNAMANSGLLFSGVVNFYTQYPYPDTYDGILTAYEAQNLNLQNTSLVVLSACETTLGLIDAGEGIYGLQRAFKAAGAASVMTSLWKIDDNATKDFMTAFYTHLMKSKNKYEAYRTAQKHIKEKYIHPYYWGAFMLFGE